MSKANTTTILFFIFWLFLSSFLFYVQLKEFLENGKQVGGHDTISKYEPEPLLFFMFHSVMKSKRNKLFSLLHVFHYWILTDIWILPVRGEYREGFLFTKLIMCNNLKMMFWSVLLVLVLMKTHFHYPCYPALFSYNLFTVHFGTTLFFLLYFCLS